MSAIKEQISEAISRAKADLDNALGTLEKIPSFDAMFNTTGEKNLLDLDFVLSIFVIGETCFG